MGINMISKYDKAHGLGIGALDCGIQRREVSMPLK